jgi:hypothetical protein
MTRVKSIARTLTVAVLLATSACVSEAAKEQADLQYGVIQIGQSIDVVEQVVGHGSAANGQRVKQTQVLGFDIDNVKYRLMDGSTLLVDYSHGKVVNKERTFA